MFPVELSELLNSLVDIAKTQRLSEDNVNALINSMFTSAGFENKESLNYEDFKTMMKEFKGDFLAIGLDCRGAKQNYLGKVIYLLLQNYHQRVLI